MAVMRRSTCHRCGAETYEARSPFDISYPMCSTCHQEQIDREHREFIAGREGLTIEERLRDLEEFMYQHRRTDHSRDISNVVYG